MASPSPVGSLLHPAKTAGFAMTDLKKGKPSIILVKAVGVETRLTVSNCTGG
jgi:hypothetical protein